MDRPRRRDSVWVLLSAERLGVFLLVALAASASSGALTASGARPPMTPAGAVAAPPATATAWVPGPAPAISILQPATEGTSEVAVTAAEPTPTPAVTARPRSSLIDAETAAAVARIVEEFGRFATLVPERADYDRFSQIGPSTCRPYRGGLARLWPTDRWCFRCSVEGSAWDAWYTFYPDLTQGECTLQTIQLHSNVSPQEISCPEEGDCDPESALDANEALTRSLVKELRGVVGQRTGAAVVVGRPPRGGRASAEECDDISECGSGYWRHLWRWCSPERRAYLYVEPDEDLRDRVTLGFLARFGPIRELQRLDAIERWDVSLLQSEAAPAGLLTDARGAFVLGDCEWPPGLIAASADPDVDRELCSGIATLKRTRRKDPWFPALAYWLHHALAARGRVEGIDTSAPWRRAMIEAAEVGIEIIDWQRHYEMWHVRDSLLRELAAGFEHTRWGQRALLELSWRGWEDGDCCQAGGLQYESVIERAERHLAECPSSTVRIPLLLVLAEAYETWWSVAKAGPDSEEFYDARPEGIPAAAAERARVKALEYYRLFIEECATLDGLQRLWLDHVLFRLERDIDTSQRQFVCWCD